MDKIYLQAEQVLVWLGERGKPDLSDDILLYGRDHAKHHEEAPFGLFVMNVRFNKWWYRAWTFQEAVCLSDSPCTDSNANDLRCSRLVAAQAIRI